MPKILTNNSALYAHGQLAAEAAKSTEDIAKKLMQGGRVKSPDEDKFSSSALMANSSMMNNVASRSYEHHSDFTRSTDTAAAPKGTTYQNRFGDFAYISDETRKKLADADPAKAMQKMHETHDYNGLADVQMNYMKLQMEAYEENETKREEIRNTPGGFLNNMTREEAIKQYKTMNPTNENAVQSLLRSK